MTKRIVFVLGLFLFFVSPSMVRAEEKIGDCLACHQKETRGIFLAWVNSKHAQKGVDCITCHKTTRRLKPKNRPSNPRCVEVHSARYDQFQQGRHSVSWDRIKGHPQYQALPEPLRKHSANDATTSRTNAIAATPPMPST